MIRYIIAAVLFIGIASCNKWEDKVVRNLSGTIIDTVSNEPISNTELLLWVWGRNPGINAKAIPETFSFSTDSNGNFDVAFNSMEGLSLAIHYPNEVFYANGGRVYVWEGNIGGREFKKDIGTVRAYKK